MRNLITVYWTVCTRTCKPCAYIYSGWQRLSSQLTPSSRQACWTWKKIHHHLYLRLSCACENSNMQLKALFCSQGTAPQLPWMGPDRSEITAELRWRQRDPRFLPGPQSRRCRRLLHRLPDSFNIAKQNFGLVIKNIPPTQSHTLIIVFIH